MRASVVFCVPGPALAGWILLLSLGLAGCGNHSPAPAPATAVAPAAAPAGPMIVRLVGRKYSVVISAGPRGPVYTFRTPGGQLLAQGMMLDELRLSRADLYDKIAPAFSPGRAMSSAAVTGDMIAGMR
jgi:hypothetical protein